MSTGRIGKFFAFLRLKLLELRYLPHLEVRLVHDKTYAKSKVYKKWTDNKYSSAVHRAVLIAFIASFTIFSVLQTFIPLFNLAKPNVAQAGANSVTWTTRGDLLGLTAPSGSTLNALNLNDIEISGESNTDDATATAGPPDLNTWSSSTTTTGAPVGRYNHTAIWTGEKMIVWGGITNTNETNSGGIWTPNGADGCSTAGGCWEATSLTNAPSAREDHTAIWTGEKMIVWGGYGYNSGWGMMKGLITGGIWTPDGADGCSTAGGCWEATSLEGAVNSSNMLRQNHTAIWTGSKMIIWGGFGGTYDNAYLNSGLIWTPDGADGCSTAGGCWVATSQTNVPSVRENHTAIWTGEKMIVWGGVYAGSTQETGALYDPSTNVWVSTSTVDVPAARTDHTAIWTGEKMIVWGGKGDGSSRYNTGGIYNPSTDSWAPVSTTSAPLGRSKHTAVWTGSKMIIYGGVGLVSNGCYDPEGLNSYDCNQSLSDGRIFNPENNSWSSITGTAPSEARGSHTSVFSGQNIIHWGGAFFDQENYDSSITILEGTGGLMTGAYPPSSSIAGYRIDSGANVKGKWSLMTWSPITQNLGTTLKFQTRGTNIAVPNGSTLNNQVNPDLGWTSWLDVNNSSDSIMTSPTRWLELKVIMTSTGLNYGQLSDFTVTYDTLETPTNSNIILTKTDGTSLKNSSGDTITGGQSGAYSNETSLRVTANNLTCGGGDSGQPACATASIGLRPEVQASTAADFSSPISATAATDTNYADLTGLAANTPYYLRVRAIDNEGRVSGWTNYGGTTPDTADITIEQTAPVGTVSINSGANFATSTDVTLTLSATDTGGSALSQMRFSNDGITWSDWESYATSKDWSLPTGEGTKTVYVQFSDNSGNLSGTWTQTSQADFQTGSLTGELSATNLPGALKLVRAPITTALRPDGAGLYTNFEEQSPASGSHWDKVDEVTLNTSDYVKTYTNDVKELYSTGGTIFTDEEIVKINIHLSDYGMDEIGGGEFSTQAGFFDGTGEYFASNIANTDLATNPRTGSQWTVSEINNLQIGIKAFNNGSSVTLYQTYVDVTYNATATSMQGTYESAVKDNATPQNYGAIFWSASVPSQAGADALRFQVASNNDNATWNYIGPDGTAGTYYTTSGTQLHSSHNGHRYIRYKSHLQTADIGYTPAVYDVSIEVNTTTSDTITLDTQPPTAFTLSSPTNPTYSSTDNNPTFNWSASTGHDTYQLVINDSTNSPGRTGIASGDNSTTPAAALSEASHTWTIKAVDVAGNETSASNGPFTYVYDTTAPTINDNLRAPIGESTVSSIKVYWDAAVDSASGIAGYTLEYKLLDDVSWTTAQTGANCNLTSGTSCVINGLEGGYLYQLRLKATNNASVSTDYITANGYTVDTLAPTVPDLTPGNSGDSYGVFACDGTLDKCSNINNKGYENKIAWVASSDTGVGVAGYKIYRAAETNSINPNDFTLVGYFNVTSGPQNLVYYDNDTNNDATFTDEDRGNIKTVASPRLNDYVTYYYRVTAIDKGGYESDIIPIDPEQGPQNTNYGSARTADVSDPSIPTDLAVTPIGVDTLNGDPLTQAMDISWSASPDTRTPGRTPAGNGSLTKEYDLYQAQGDINGPTEAFQKIATVSGTSASREGLAEDTYYYYKVLARDNVGNTSDFSVESGRQTKNSFVPSTVTAVYVESKTGNPNTDQEVGDRATISFVGSKIKGTGNRVDGYRIYRSESNILTEEQWKALTPIHTISGLAIATETQDPGDNACEDYALTVNGNPVTYGDNEGIRCFTDTGLDDATTYYYKVQAFGWNDTADPGEQNITAPSLSQIAPGTLHYGWDITPDATAPDQPAEVTVKDIHGNASLYRNIITWQMIATPQRQGSSDFAKYVVYRYETTDGVLSAVPITEKSDIGDNFHVDGIPDGSEDIDYSYYVVALDNAGTAFKYSNGTVINAVANNSGYSGTVSINPGAVRPTVSNTGSVNPGVSSATIVWNTNQPCDSLVEYRVKGTDTVIAAGKNRTEPVTSHSVGLVGLQKGETYQYRIVSKNSLGNLDSAAATTWYEFETQDFTITTPAVSATTTTATVTWKTNINSDSNVEYKPESSASESSTAGDPVLTQNHEVVIKGLKPATTYTYKIRSVSADNYITDTNFATFTTKPFDSSQFVIAPSASNVAEQNITATSAKIVWNTAIETDTWVDFGTSSGNYSQSAGDEALNTVHVVELKNLTPGNTYYYRVRGRDANFVEYTSKEYVFTAVLKPKIEGLKLDITSSYTAVITFSTNVDTESSVTFGKDGALDLKAGTTEFKRNHIIELNNLEDDTTYTYFVEVRDKLQNGQRSANASFATPLDREGPKVENLKIDMLPLGESDEYAQVIISWNTNKPSTTKVEYDEGMISGKYGKSTIEDTTLSTSHTVIIKDLNPSSTYHFRIAGKDKRGNQTNSQDYNFVTPEKNKSVWQLIVRSLEETFSWVKNVGGFFKGIGKKTE